MVHLMLAEPERHGFAVSVPLLPESAMSVVRIGFPLSLLRECKMLGMMGLVRKARKKHFQTSHSHLWIDFET